MVVIEIVSPIRIRVSGDDVPWTELDAETSFRPKGYQFTPAYRTWTMSGGKRGWDGYVHLMYRNPTKPHGTLPRGLTNRVLSCVQREGRQFKVVETASIGVSRELPTLPTTESTKWPSGESHLKSMEDAIVQFVVGPQKKILPAEVIGKDLRDYQRDAVIAAMRHGSGILDMATNAGKTAVAASIIKSHGVPRTLYIVHMRTLKTQVVDNLTKMLGLPDGDVGMIGGGVWNPSKVTVAIINSVTIPKPKREEGGLSWKDRERKEKILELLGGIELLMLDEVHHASSTTWYDTMKSCNARYRIGMSGTPLSRSDERNIMVESTCGPVIYSVDQSHLQEIGVSADVDIHFIPVRKPVIDQMSEWYDIHKTGVINNPHLNKQVVDIAVREWKAGKRVMVLVNETRQGRLLSDYLTQYENNGDSGMVPHSYRHAGVPDRVIAEQKAAFEAGDTTLMIASPIFGEGVDIPNIDILLIPDGGKAVIRVVQRIGRGLRKGKEAKNLKVYDFVCMGHGRLKQHARERLAVYERESFNVRWEEVNDHE